jgi:hypothetical protein
MRLLSSEVELPGTARRPLAALGVASAVCLLPRSAAAAEKVRLDYRAPVECPDAPIFIERVRTRVPSARMAEPEDLAREVSIVVALDEEGYMARLDFVDVRGDTITRTLAGKTCDEVVSGIALVTALALEAQHETTQNDTAPATTTANEPSGEETPPGPPLTAPPSTPIEPESAPRPEPAARRRRATRLGFRHGAGAGAGNAWYLAPGTPVVFDGMFRLSHTSLAGSLRAGFRGWISNTTTIGGRSANFLGYAASIEGCPTSWPRSFPVRFEPCLGVALGVLEAHGNRTEQLEDTADARIFWADARGIARFRLAVSKLVELDGQAELGIPLRTHRFLFENPQQTVFEVPRIGLGWRAGVMLHFP